MYNFAKEEAEGSKD